METVTCSVVQCNKFGKGKEGPKVEEEEEESAEEEGLQGLGASQGMRTRKRYNPTPYHAAKIELQCSIKGCGVE